MKTFASSNHQAFEIDNSQIFFKNVALCGGGGGGGGNGGGGGHGGGQMRLAMETSIGDMLLDHWSGKNVESPLPYFSKYMSGPRQPSQGVVESVLVNTFKDGFSATLNKGDSKKVSSFAAAALKNEMAKEGLIRPTTHGFRDLTFHIAEDHPIHDMPVDKITRSKQEHDLVSKDSISHLNEASETLALMQTIGSFVMDITCNYPVSNLVVGFQANGGRDANIINALDSAYQSSFSDDGKYLGGFGRNFSKALYQSSKESKSNYALTLSGLISFGGSLMK